MTATQLIGRAAALLRGPESYSRHAAGAVVNPDTAVFSLTGLLERANCRRPSGARAVQMLRGEDAPLIEAKALLCRRPQAAHLDDWEARNRPQWSEVRAVLEGAC